MDAGRSGARHCRMSPNHHPLLTYEQHVLMLSNGLASSAGDETDRAPVVKLFTPDAQCVWLLSELDPHDPDIAFGLCDLGMGSPELGSVRLSEIGAVKGPLGLAVERDLYFRANKTLGAYADLARRHGAIRA